MSNQLVRLPNGAWVRPADVASVTPRVGRSGPPYVTVYTGSRSILLRCDTFEAAKALADELATKFNLATAKPEEPKCT